MAPEVPGWLAGKAEYDGRFALEGAKEVPTILARHVSLTLAADGQGVEVRWDDTDEGKGEAAARESAGSGGGESPGAGGHGEL